MPNSEYWESFFEPERILLSLGILDNIKDVADFGSGYGTFSIAASKMIDGNVFAIDIDKAMIDFLDNRIIERNIGNIVSIHTDIIKNGSSLNDNSVDLVLLFNILHTKYLGKIMNESKRILRENGKIAVIHWIMDKNTPRGPNLDIRPSPESIINLVTENKIRLLRKIELPPYHYGILFGI